ncbi:Hypothetical protein A7982_05517 [Minicystis rosea]|nr:Hypothetical protein A7982_05517 [Minicystis rosea]
MVARPIYLSRDAFRSRGLVVVSFDGLAGAYFVEVDQPDADEMVALLEESLRNRTEVEVVFTMADSRIIAATPVR